MIAVKINGSTVIDEGSSFIFFILLQQQFSLHYSSVFVGDRAIGVRRGVCKAIDDGQRPPTL
jgi:hypothetical protein